MTILEEIFGQHLEAFASEFFIMLVKGIVHPKNENSVIYSPSSSSKPV